MKLSKNFSLSEFLKSNVATRRNISNDPTKEGIVEMQNLCQNLLQPLRDCLGPIRVNSGWRSIELNKALGGAYKIISSITPCNSFFVAFNSNIILALNLECSSPEL